MFLDISKAYDTVSRNILFKKLSKENKISEYLPIFQSLFDDNIVNIHYNNQVSEDISLNIGLTQGSILNPFLFIVFINDLPDLIHKRNGQEIENNVLLYTDDICIITKNKASADSAMEDCSKYSITNNFNFNVIKSGYISKADYDIKYKDDKIPKVNYYTYLGLYTDINGINLKSS